MRRIESNDESMFKGDFQRELGIHQCLVKSSASGSCKTNVGVVESFNRMIKLYLHKRMEKYNKKDWTNILSEALHHCNYEK